MRNFFFTAIKLQKRWKNLRDCFNREIRIRKNDKRPSAVSRNRQYSYYNQLSFLKPVSEKRYTGTSNRYPETSITSRNEDEQRKEDENESTLNEIENEQTFKDDVNEQTHYEGEIRAKNKIEQTRNVDIAPALSIISHKRLKNKRKKQQNSADITESPKPRINKRPINEDTQTDNDMLFLMSLHQDLKSIDDYYKLEAKTEIINVIRKYKSPPQFHHHNSVFYEDRDRHFLRGQTLSQNENPQDFLYQEKLERQSVSSSSSSVEEKPHFPLPAFTNNEASPESIM